jgi:hypothetical protein
MEIESEFQLKGHFRNILGINNSSIEKESRY